MEYVVVTFKIPQLHSGLTVISVNAVSFGNLMVHLYVVSCFGFSKRWSLENFGF